MEIQLYISDNLGQTWQKISSAAGTGRLSFSCRARRILLLHRPHGRYQRQGSPASIQPGSPPQIRVCVDTQAPLVSLSQAPPGREGRVGVEWEIRDENLDVNNLLLEYRTPGSQDWIPLSVEGGRTGQRYWNPAGTGSIYVRLRVRDLATNAGAAHRTISVGSGAYTGYSRQLGATYNDPDAGRGARRARPREPRTSTRNASVSITKSRKKALPERRLSTYGHA